MGLFQTHEPIESHDLTEPVPEETQARGKTSFQDTWLLEIIALIFSVFSFVAIIGILSGYNGRPSPDLSLGLTLNTIVSVLGTISKSALIFVVASSIGQLKWLWFRRNEGFLSDIQTFDDASRGPLGALTILVQPRGSLLVSLGAMITTLALAFDPFAQQILSYPIRQTSSSSDHATARQARYFLPGLDSDLYTDYFNAGLWANDFEVPPSCSTGNCTWPSFQSIGLCSSCQDVTSSSSLHDCDHFNYNLTGVTEKIHNCKLEVTNATTEAFELIYSGTRNAASVPIDLLWALNAGNRSDDYAYAGLVHPITAIGHATLDLPQTHNLTGLPKPIGIKRVQECALSVCLKTYDVSMSSGSTSINITSVDYGEYFHANPTNTTDLKDPERRYNCWKPSSSSSVDLTELPNADWVDPASFAFCPTNYTFEEMNQIIFSEPFLGSSSYAYYEAKNGLWTQMPLFNYVESDGKETFSRILNAGLDTAMANVASALTKFSLMTSNGTVVHGSAMLSEAYVAVTWPWLILPALLVLAGLVLFVATAVVHRRHQQLALWKSSILPLLYHVNFDRADAVADHTTISKMEKSARAVRVKLDSDASDMLMQIDSRGIYSHPQRSLDRWSLL